MSELRQRGAPPQRNGWVEEEVVPAAEERVNRRQVTNQRRQRVVGRGPRPRGPPPPAEAEENDGLPAVARAGNQRAFAAAQFANAAAVAAAQFANDAAVAAARPANVRAVGQQQRQLLLQRPVNRNAGKARDEALQRDFLRFLVEQATEAAAVREAMAQNAAAERNAAGAAAQNTQRGLRGIERGVVSVGREAARGTAAGLGAAAEAREAARIAAAGLDVGVQGLAVGEQTQRQVSMVQATTNLLVRKSNAIIAQGAQILTTVTRTESMVGRLSVAAAYQQGNRIGFIGAWVQNEWLMCATFIILTPVFPVSVQSVQSWYALTMGTVRGGQRIMQAIHAVSTNNVSLSFSGVINTVSPISLMMLLWRVNGQLTSLRAAGNTAYTKAFEGSLENNLPHIIRGGREFASRAWAGDIPNPLPTITPEMRQRALDILTWFFRKIYSREMFTDLGSILYGIVNNPGNMAQWLLDFISGNASVIIDGVIYTIRSTVGQHYFDGLYYTLGTWQGAMGAMGADLIAWIFSSLWWALEATLGMIYRNVMTLLRSALCAILIRVSIPMSGPMYGGDFDRCMVAMGEKPKTQGGSRKRKMKRRYTKKSLVQRGGAEGELQTQIKDAFVDVFFELTMLEISRVVYNSRNLMLDRAINAMYESQAIVYEITLQKSLGYENSILPLVDENVAIVPYKSIIKMA